MIETSPAKSARPLQSVAVFCGSSRGRAPEHIALATRLGEAIAARGLKLVYGGGGLGLGVMPGGSAAGGGQFGAMERTLDLLQK